jgi:hypothetical protein
MTTQYTPGPWSIDWDARAAGYPINAAQPKRIGTNRICSTRPVDRSTESYTEAEANARLIAAAPDLLAALQWCVKCWETGAWQNEDGESPDISQVESAIAKATGNDS